jgi:hypothetical protein
MLHSNKIFIQNFQQIYDEEINIAYSLACILTNKDLNSQLFINETIVLDNKLKIHGHLIGYRKDIKYPSGIISDIVSNILSKNYYEIVINETIDKLDQKITITFNLEELQKHKENLLDIKTYLKLINLYAKVNYA